ncbi:N-acetylmuramoyl-L-alanine amidase [Pedobacter antarcticus]|uniref:N-acetylmuramoyl-L-alanine amidase n=1 Tax=Pedobacter antarcticus TaxID=34086 RepID=UPI002930D50B|nr:N-acetylmuramoyl-L-alanine amidase [Pedobacter antarcticus]
MEFIYYLLKVSICLALFFGTYVLFLKKLSFFKVNRMYLLATLLLSFAIPSLKFERSPEIAAPRFFSDYDTVEHISGKSLSPIVVNDATGFLSISDLFFYTYLLGTLIFLSVSCFKIYQLIRYTGSEFIRIDGLKVIYKKSGFVNCSFFNYVFIDQDSLTKDEMQILLTHERVHAKQLHTLDKLVLLFCKSLLWFNPVIYWYEAALEEVHEFDADQITATAFSADIYANLLIGLASKKPLNPILHGFSKQPLKTRIVRLFTKTSPARLRWYYLTIIPLLVCLSWIFAFKAPDISLKQNAGNSNFVLVLDAGHGGTDKGAEGGGFSEKDLALLILQKVNRIANERNVKVITTRNIDQYLSLKDRVKAKGDLLISFHLNQDIDPEINGIQLLVGNAGADSAKRKKLDKISYQLYKNLSQLNGIAVDNIPKEVESLYILNRSSAPAIILELGYLTNLNDRDYLTDPIKQDELANTIVSSIIEYSTILNREK